MAITPDPFFILAMDHGNLHIVMLPWLAFGHLTPFLELSKRLAGKGHHISFLSTPKNIERLAKVDPPNLAPLIDFVKLPLPLVDGLPENIEATIDLPDDTLRPLVSKIMDDLEEHMASFLEKTSPVPDWIVYDYAPCWVPRVAARFGVPCAFLSLFNAAVLSFIGPPSSRLGGSGGDDGNNMKKPEDLTVSPKWVPFPSSVVFRLHEVRQLFKPVVPRDASGKHDGHRFATSIQECHAVAVRSCEEFEPEYLHLLEELYRKPVIPVGLFPPLVQDSPVDDEIDTGCGVVNIFEWLNKQAPSSVVYVAFGSEVRLSREQAHEIAHGLDSSELPFVWAFRRPPGIPDEVEMFPEGFRHRTEGRGVVCTGWVPQSRILSHPSVGGFLTHCGWNSIVEGLQFGLALALLPMVFDQALNARLLEEKKAGVEVPRDEEGGSFTGDGIARTLRMVMVDEEGEPLRVRARELKDVFGDVELQDRYVSGFLGYLREHRRR